ncbi:MAG: class I SAM-dependent methyltransferase [Pseudomonadota bacterium]
METNHKYHLKTGTDGEAQLDNLDRIFGKASREFLNHIGLSKGMSVLDVGCGIGNLTCWLAEQVGSNGRVVGVDNDERQLEVARNRAQARRLSNIVFCKKDAHHLTDMNHEFDMAYCRWLLIHVRNPSVVVDNMANTLRSGGILACEVGNSFSSFYYPTFPLYIKLQDKIAELLKKSGCDLDIAMNIFKICKGLQHFSFNAKMSQEIIYNLDEAKAFTRNYCLVLDSMKDAFLENNIMSEKEIVEIREALLSDRINRNTVIFLTRMTQVWCVKS